MPAGEKEAMHPLSHRHLASIILYIKKYQSEVHLGFCGEIHFIEPMTCDDYEDDLSLTDY